MKIKVFIANQNFPDRPQYSRVIEGDNIPVPRLGDHVDLGYTPTPKVTTVLWNYDKCEVIVAVE